MIKRIISGLALFGVAITTAGCARDADVALQNLSYAADNFEINRRIVFYNGITGGYILTIEGLCAQKPEDSKKLSVTCKTGPGQYKKHFLGLSDNVTYFSEQIDPAPAGTYHYRVVFKPAAIIPDIDFK
jgi:hypothetical protein